MARRIRNFGKAKKEGEEFEQAGFPILRAHLATQGFVLLKACQILPTNQYRLDNFRFPDNMAVPYPANKNETRKRQFIEFKRKNGWPERGRLFVTIEKKYIDDYLALSHQYDAVLFILMYCNRNKKAYIIDNFSNLQPHVFNNNYSDKADDISYKFFVDDLTEAPDFSGIL